MDAWFRARAVAIREALHKVSGEAAAKLYRSSAYDLRKTTGNEPTLDFRDRLLAEFAAIAEGDDVARLDEALAVEAEKDRAFWSKMSGRDMK